MMDGQVQRKIYVDLLIVVSCLGVVFLHANGVFWSHPTGRLWVTSNIIETIFYYAVPIFFMISGCTLIDYKKRYNIKVYLFKRCQRTFVPFIVWSIIALAILSILGRLPQEELTFCEVLLGIINCTYFPIYWFFIPLFACYLSIPVLAQVENKVVVFLYLAIYGFISISVLPFVSSYFVISRIQNIYSPMNGGGRIYSVYNIGI